MSFIGSMFSGDKGAGYQAGSANILNPVDPNQVTQTYNNADEALQKQKAFIDAVNAANPLATQNQVLAQQQATAQQLQGIANGTGPNPAQTMLDTATGNNVASTAALMASQRGAGANAGLIARNAGLAGAAAGQQAAGQAATLQANQSLNAIGALGSQQNNIQNVAANQLGTQAGALKDYNNNAQGLQQNILNAAGNQNNANVAMQSNVNNANAGIAGVNAKGQQDFVGNIAGSAGSALMLAAGGEVPNLKENYSASPKKGPKSFVGQYLASGGKVDDASTSSKKLLADNLMAAPAAQPAGLGKAGATAGKALGQGINKLGSLLGGGSPDAGSTNIPGTSPNLGIEGVDAAPVSSFTLNAASAVPGTAFSLGVPAAFAMGGDVGGKLKSGGKVAGKAKVMGDSLKNDTVDAKLSPGEVVIPRSVMQSKDPVSNAAKFVAAIMAKEHMKMAMKKA